jgi:hypothetical protein
MTNAFETSRHVARSPIAYSDDALIADINRVEAAWARYRADRRRAAIYRFLASVFEVIQIWQADNKAEIRALRALIRVGADRPNVIEPFSALIAVAAHPTKIDDRTLSKWSRVLRHAASEKLSSMSLAAFIKRNGGINQCAALFTRQAKRIQKRKGRFRRDS